LADINTLSAQWNPESKNVRALADIPLFLPAFLVFIL
jgi:hypothetical protein